MLIVLCGPTAAGKTQVALELASALGGAILGADSRQIYRDFDIGTAKPSSQERAQVPHYLIDCWDPRQTGTVGDYQDLAQPLIEQLHLQGQVPLLVGGTGLYIKAITAGLRLPRIPPQSDLRRQLANLGQPYCYQLLKQVDSQAARHIHANDALRTVRALEVFYATGQPISRLQTASPPDYPVLYFGLDSEQLWERIAARTRQIFQQGLLEEVKSLEQQYGPGLPLLETLGYREVCRYLAGQDSLEQALENTILRTRQFAKRQRTWFRAIPQIQWFDSDTPGVAQEIFHCIQDFANGVAQSRTNITPLLPRKSR
jgi:tRNA dimethylallyltransferase